MSDSTEQSDATGLLRQMTAGDSAAQGRLLSLLYGQLHHLAAGQMARQRAGHTLQATALVNEAFVRLIRTDEPWASREHFLAVAAKAMRQVLVDHARRKASHKRGGDWDRVTLSGVGPGTGQDQTDLLALDAALTRLQELNPRHARVVELRAFGGLTTQEVAEVLDMGVRTVEKDWRLAKAWLARELR